MRVIVIGAGTLGKELLNNLTQKENNEIIVIDTDKENCDNLASEYDVLVLNGDGTDPDILKKARIKDSDSLIAITGSDAINTVIAMLGSQFGVKKIIVKLTGTGLRSACRSIGVKKIIAPTISAASEISAVLYGYDRVNFSIIEKGSLIFEGLNIKKAKGNRLGDIEFPSNTHVVAVLRSDKVLLPNEDITLKEEDEILILAENKNAIEKARNILDNSGENEKED